jgi:hypothetical protein
MSAGSVRSKIDEFSVPRPSRLGFLSGIIGDSEHTEGVWREEIEVL